MNKYSKNLILLMTISILAGSGVSARNLDYSLKKSEESISVNNKAANLPTRDLVLLSANGVPLLTCSDVKKRLSGMRKDIPTKELIDYLEKLKSFELIFEKDGWDKSDIYIGLFTDLKGRSYLDYLEQIFYSDFGPNLVIPGSEIEEYYNRVSNKNPKYEENLYKSLLEETQDYIKKNIENLKKMEDNVTEETLLKNAEVSARGETKEVIKKNIKMIIKIRKWIEKYKDKIPNPEKFKNDDYFDNVLFVETKDLGIIEHIGNDLGWDDNVDFINLFDANKLMLYGAYFRVKAEKEIKISDEEVEDYYKKNKDSYEKLDWFSRFQITNTLKAKKLRDKEAEQEEEFGKLKEKYGIKEDKSAIEKCISSV